MATVTVRAGVCGSQTTIRTASEDSQMVYIAYDSTCSHLAKVGWEGFVVDAHAACPPYSSFLQVAEVAAGMALPRDVPFVWHPW